MDNAINTYPKLIKPIPDDQVVKPYVSPLASAISSYTAKNQKLSGMEGVIKKVADQFGIPMAVAYGQYAAEGRNKGLGASRNNFYNVQAYDNYEDQMPTFKTPEEGVKAWAKVIAHDPRYAQAMKLRGNPAAMMQAIQEAGYATRPDYAQFVMSTPEFQKYAGGGK